MSRIEKVSLDQLVDNPHRMLSTYPTIESKVEALRRSIEDVGLWESIIARPAENKFEIAFGHHRVIAARRAGLDSVPIIVKALDDEQMLQYMGRENGEDYGTQFLVMLNTWEGAWQWLSVLHQDVEKLQAIDCARVLGWTRDHKDGTFATSLANGCHSARTLIDGGYLAREDLDGLTVSAAQHIVTRARARMDAVDKVETATPKQKETAKRDVGKAAKTVAEKSRKGEVAQKDLRTEVDLETMGHSAKRRRSSPLFAEFAKSLTSTIDRTLKSDATAQRLQQVKQALKMLEHDSDKELVQQLSFDLASLQQRAERWAAKMVVPEKSTKASAQGKLVALDGGRADG